MLKPGIYSIFVLNEDNTFQQPSIKINKPMKAHDFKMVADHHFGGFISVGVDLDFDCDRDDAIEIG